MLQGLGKTCKKGIFIGEKQILARDMGKGLDLVRKTKDFRL
jgi:hypothetical protein